jgi:signal transduction histidine kinase
MNRRVLGPVGGPIGFALVAGLVFSGLGWVTYSALQVEQAQRLAAARAELEANLRVALWRLDGRMLPTLGVEDNRPFSQYAPADPSNPAAATPLLAATLPDWMKLHFQLDPTRGWESPQVLDAALVDRLRQAWPELTLRNCDDHRMQALAELRANFPVLATCELFAQRDSTAAEDSLPHPAPGHPPGSPTIAEAVAAGSTTAKPPPAAEPTIKPLTDATSRYIQMWGYELCLPADQLATSKSAPAPAQSVDFDNNGMNSRSNQSLQTNPMLNNRSGRLPQPELQNRAAWNDWMKRAETTDKALKEARQGGDLSYSRGQFNPNFQTNWPSPNGDARNSANLMQLGPGGPPGNKNDANAGSFPLLPPGSPPAGAGGGKALASGRGQAEPMDENDGRKQHSAEALRAGPGTDGATPGMVAVAGPAGVILHRSSVDRARSFNQLAGTHPATTPPAEPGPRPPTDGLPLPVAIHLGSMRPLWVTATSGAEMLVLVRTARFENKTMYQGVVLDWPKLEAVLKEEVKDLFPEAKLVPVKDTTAVAPDRTMTALPIQLDPGSEQPLPPAGWTPLRIGLVLAWTAALVAVAAVGLSGWSLIDLAERRIKFVSAVTHELRTPLTSLRLYLDLLTSGLIQDEAQRQEYLKTLTEESDRLHRLIDNVLDFAKLEKRRTRGDIQPVRVQDILDQLRATWTDRLAREHKQLLVLSTLPPDHEVRTDGEMVQQIVGNLIDNAKKYTRDAADQRIWVWARPGDGNGIVIEVEDRGPGIPAGERRTIFKPFRRGGQADSKAGGAGLGLALAKSWAEVLGGRLSYRPADGGIGSCFRLELPGN